ncbi:DUF2760 domain-containing protein [bacterium]|nr:DUF2760 domain-containing protein [bacterium]
MDRLIVALICFFRILLARPLPVERLPKGALPRPAPVPLPLTTSAPAPVAPVPVVETKPAVDVAKERAQAFEGGAFFLLTTLQREGRLVDFLMEKIDGYDDAQVGAAVRGIHAGCKKALADAFALEPILAGAEESPVTIQPGFDVRSVRLTGNVVGSPPFKGTLKHHGWRGKTAKPLGPSDGADLSVVAPAEVEL